MAGPRPFQSRGDWVIEVSAAKVFTKEKFDAVSVGDQPVTGADLSINDDTTVSFDVSYFLTPSVALNVFGGVPASARLRGRGALAGLELGKTDYGPAIVSLQYHRPLNERLDAYGGVGVGRLLFVNEGDGAVAGFHVEDAWAPALQAGTRYRLAGDWMANVDVRYAPFKAKISGRLGPAPVAARVKVDPLIVDVGLAYSF